MKQLSSDVINYHCNYFQKIYFLLFSHLPTSFTSKRDIQFTPSLPCLVPLLLKHIIFTFKPRGAKINLISTCNVKIFTLLRSNDDFSFGLRREHQPAQTAPAVTGLLETLRMNWCDGVESDTRLAF